MIEEAALQAVRADAAYMCVNLFQIPGAPGVTDQCVQNIIRLKLESEDYGMPMMVEQHLVRQAVELGADVIKADPTDDISRYHKIVKAACGIPVLVRGGGKASDEEILTRTEALIQQGVSGIVYGRNVIRLMFARHGQTTPCHTHARKKEDIICRAGALTLELWPAKPGSALAPKFSVSIDGELVAMQTGVPFTLTAGSRVTLVPGVWHAFHPARETCIIGEVSKANDDLHDNIFLDPNIGRFPGIEEDEPALISLVSEQQP